MPIDERRYWDLRRALFQVMDRENASDLLDILERADALRHLRIEGPFTLSILSSENLRELESRCAEFDIRILESNDAAQGNRILIEIAPSRPHSRQNLLSPPPNRLELLRSPLSRLSSGPVSPTRAIFTPISINSSSSLSLSEEMDSFETLTPPPPPYQSNQIESPEMESDDTLKPLPHRRHQ